ncbi:MAG: hypothetical protein KDH96_07050 [Candidatus Riesia sp.]|nr:hypothetical protein [Candidatus Riesia sp.]
MYAIKGSVISNRIKAINFVNKIKSVVVIPDKSVSEKLKSIQKLTIKQQVATIVKNMHQQKQWSEIMDAEQQQKNIRREVYVPPKQDDDLYKEVKGGYASLVYVDEKSKNDNDDEQWKDVQKKQNTNKKSEKRVWKRNEYTDKGQERKPNFINHVPFNENHTTYNHHKYFYHVNNIDDKLFKSHQQTVRNLSIELCDCVHKNQINRDLHYNTCFCCNEPIEYGDTVINSRCGKCRCHSACGEEIKKIGVNPHICAAYFRLNGKESFKDLQNYVLMKVNKSFITHSTISWPDEDKFGSFIDKKVEKIINPTMHVNNFIYLNLCCFCGKRFVNGEEIGKCMCGLCVICEDCANDSSRRHPAINWPICSLALNNDVEINEELANYLFEQHGINIYDSEIAYHIKDKFGVDVETFESYQY